MTPLAAFALAGCLAVAPGADRITLGDFAPAFPGVEAALPETPVAYAPAPGVRRVFRLPELRSLAAHLKLAWVPQNEICFERPLATLDDAQILDAMRRTLPQARIEVLNRSHFPVPQGEIEFPASGLRQTSAGGLWNGSIRYAANQRTNVWARVKVLIPSMRVVAARDLLPGQPLSAEHLSLEEGSGLPAANAFAASIDQVAGKVLRRSVRAGTPLRPEWLGGAKEVNRGDTVRVEVRSGGARLEMEGRAAAAGTLGETILVLNPATKRSFRARVEGKGRVSVGL